MIESLLIQALETETGTPAVVFLPEVLPDELFVIDRTGTDQRDKIITVDIAVQAYALTAQRAAEMIETGIDVIEALVADGDISKAKMTNCYFFTDTVRKRPRYQATFEITHYL